MISKFTLLHLFLFQSVFMCAAQSFTSMEFHRRKNVTLILNAVQDAVRSNQDCATRCVKWSSCISFCHSRSSSVCLFSTQSDGEAHLMTLIDEAYFDCFDKDGCPLALGYTLHGGYCIKAYGQEKNYYDAKSTCERDGAHLYHFKSLGTDKQPLIDLNTGSILLWVGAQRLKNGTHHQFMWSDMSPMEGPWMLAEPSNSNDIEDCVHLITSAWKLNDYPCHRTTDFVCQIDV